MSADKISKISDLIESISYRTGRSQVMTDLFTLMACAISNLCDGVHKGSREKLYLDTIKRYNEKERRIIADASAQLFDLLIKMSEPEEPFDDYLGKLYMMSNTSSSDAGQFFTPYDIARLTATVAVPKFSADDKIITIDEPACGSGGMILAAVEILRNSGINYAERVFVHASDIDSRCVKMCYIQLSLAGVPAVIHQRDTLTMQTFDEWHTPAYLFNYLKFQKYGSKC